MAKLGKEIGNDKVITMGYLNLFSQDNRELNSLEDSKLRLLLRGVKFVRESVSVFGSWRTWRQGPCGLRPMVPCDDFNAADVWSTVLSRVFEKGTNPLYALVTFDSSRHYELSICGYHSQKFSTAWLTSYELAVSCLNIHFKGVLP